MEKKDIAVIGDEEFTLGFEMAGVSQVYSGENYREEIEELIKTDELGIVVAEKSDIQELPGRLKKEVESSVDPVVVTLSETAEDSNLQEQIRKVIGADIG